MKRIALDKAAGHLELAKEAVHQMAGATNFKTYEMAWQDFLSQASRFYSKLEQGSKGCKKSEPWFGGKKHERQKDPLLSYIHHARNCEEHTIDYTASMTADSIVGKMENDKPFNIRFQYMVDDKGRQHFRNIEAKDGDGNDVPIEIVNPKLVLLQVHEKRINKKFDPPEMHRSKPIVDTTPRGIARLGVSYLEDLLDEARKLPEHF
ncbi:hypothetical protein [Sphingorhabdus sp.]|jgi:hypothetical protein|uniref:hypothetical protein n=1 Tax=Sphingorhabdus sp. TaxID=1902408 RepID=UPI0035B0375D